MQRQYLLIQRQRSAVPIDGVLKFRYLLLRQGAAAAALTNEAPAGEQVDRISAIRNGQLLSSLDISFHGKHNAASSFVVNIRNIILRLAGVVKSSSNEEDPSFVLISLKAAKYSQSLSSSCSRTARTKVG
jgi:hypothetical protein